MRTIMVRYKVKPDQVAANEQLVREVYDELERIAPAGFRYATFTLEDGVNFVHFALQESPDNPLARVEAFARFQAGLGERCEELPVVTELRPVASFRFPEPS